MKKGTMTKEWQLNNRLERIRKELTDLHNTTKNRRIKLNIQYDSILNELKKIKLNI
jgi:hypothetical protein